MTAPARVLIIDDEPAVLATTSQLLSAAGFETHTAETGEAGLEVYRQKQSEIDVVLLDMTLPGISGAETLTRLRQVDPRSKVVLTSGYDNSSPLQPDTRFLAKPFRVAALLTAVRDLLPDSACP